MNLGLLLPLGDSLKSYASHGQDVRFVKYYLGKYCQNFDHVYLFTYENEQYRDLPANCVLIRPKRKLHRYLYGLFLPLLQADSWRQCQIFRCFHPSAAIPAIVGKLIFQKKFIFNFNYDYQAWAKIEGKLALVPLLKTEEYLAFKFCDGVFVADEKMAEYAGKFVSPEKITVIRNGVDTVAFSSAKVKKIGKEKVILSVGRLEKQKNFGQLVEAVSKLGKGIRLVIVGRGELKEDLMSLAKKTVVNLEIIDVVPNDKLPEVYNRADVYVQPSLMEAPVKTLLEAMSCGLPCVATNVPGIREVINDGESGLLAGLNAGDLAQKIKLLLGDRNLAEKLGRQARETIKAKYDLKKYLELETEVLKSV